MPQDLTNLYQVADHRAKLRGLDDKIGMETTDPNFIGYEEFFSPPPQMDAYTDGPSKKYTQGDTKAQAKARAASIKAAIAGNDPWAGILQGALSSTAVQALHGPVRPGGRELGVLGISSLPPEIHEAYAARNPGDELYGIKMSALPPKELERLMQMVEAYEAKKQAEAGETLRKQGYIFEGPPKHY